MHTKFFKRVILVKLISVFMLLSFTLNNFLIQSNVVAFAADSLRSRAAKQDGGDVTGLVNELDAALVPNKNEIKEGGILSKNQKKAVSIAKEALKVDDGDDYFIKPTIVDENTTIKEGDSVILFNFRGDRAEPMLRLFTVDSTFNHFPIENLKLNIVPFAVYNDKYFKEHSLEGVVKESSFKETLGEVLAKHGKTQVRIAESGKFKHVTFFFDGLRDVIFPGVDTVQIASNNVDKHWKKPEMKAEDIAKEAVKWILGIDGKAKKDFVVINFANLDILGHFEKFDPIIEGALAVDKAMGLIREAVREAGGLLITTADHGSGEQKVKLTEKGIPLLDKEGKPVPHKAHAFDNKVPFIIEGAGNFKLKPGGSLKNISPTILELMGIAKPDEMTADSLFEQPVDKAVTGRPVVLVVRDGWGISKFNNPEALKYNAVFQAHLRAQNLGIKFNDDEMLVNDPHTELWAHGEYVGHPGYQMGDSENGHSNIGAGREVPSTLFILDKMLKTGEFTENKIVHQAIANAKKGGHKLHLVGMVSEGGVHSHIQHLFKLLQVISKEKEGMNDIVLQPIFDGRDIETSETPGWESLQQVFQEVNKLGIGGIFKIGVISGRYYAMDRDAFNQDKKGLPGSHELWLERVKPWYDAIVHGQGRRLFLTNPEELKEKKEGVLAEAGKSISTSEGKIKEGLEVLNFFDAHSRIFKLTGGKTAFRDYLRKIEEYLKLRFQATHNKLALVVHSSFLKNAGALDALKEVIKLRPYDVVLNIYGEGADKLKSILFSDNDNIHAGNTLDSLQLKGAVKLEDIVVLMPAGEKIDWQVKQVFFTEKTLSTVAVAKAMEALLNTEGSKREFKEFYAKLNKEQIISNEVYARTEEKITADFENGKFDLPDIEPAKTISEAITETEKSKAISEFFETHI